MGPGLSAAELRLLQPSKPDYPMKLVHILWAMVLATLLCACDRGPQPDSPEYAVRMWQQLVDQNRFAEAKKWSTPTTQRWLDLMRELIGEGDTSSITHTFFEKLQCHELDTTAWCIYRVREEGETIQDTFWLVQAADRWLVDLKEEVLDMRDEWMEEIFPAYAPALPDTTGQ